jgi:hypothetical protein
VGADATMAAFHRGCAVTIVLALALLFAQTATLYPASAWDGTWTWHTYEERQAWTQQWMAEVQVISQEHCGQQYYAAC